MSEILLSGCAPTLLSGYLKALGVLRLVHEQVDGRARGAWRDDGFLLLCDLSAVELREFFLSRYAPTPIVTPWNGGSGFFPKDQQAGIDALRRSGEARFEPYRRTIDACAQVLRESGLVEKPRDEDKWALLQRLRNQLPDEALPWLDAAYVIAEEPRYPALLGSGGNDGRFDFANNFMQRLGELLLGGGRRRRGAGPAEQLDAALLGGGGAGVLQDLAVGQFAPAAAGGINMGSGIEGPSRVNPWDYVLTLEGAVLFAGAAVRRLDSGAGRLGMAAFPFHVKTSAVGYGSAADVDQAAGASRGELWLPCWREPASFPELRALFSEGRLELPRSRRRAVTGLDATRALASLGVDRGIERFERFAFLRRNGLAFLATHLGSLSVPERELDHVDLLEEASARIRDLEGKDPTAAVGAALRTLQERLYQISVGQEEGLTGVLMALGRLEHAVRGARKLSVPPLRLDPRWDAAAWDGSAEYAIAASFYRWVALDDWGARGPLDNLVRRGLRRLREQGISALKGPSRVPLRALGVLLSGQLDLPRLESLLFGLSLLSAPPAYIPPRAEPALPLDPRFALLRAVTSSHVWGGGDAHPAPEIIPQILRLVEALQWDAALQLAERRLYASDVRLRVRAAALGAITAPWPAALPLQAALLMPLPRSVETRLMQTILIPTEPEIMHDEQDTTNG